MKLTEAVEEFTLQIEQDVKLYENRPDVAMLLSHYVRMLRMMVKMYQEDHIQENSTTVLKGTANPTRLPKTKIQEMPTNIDPWELAKRNHQSTQYGQEDSDGTV